MPPPWLTPSPYHPYAVLYQDINVGYKYFGPDGFKIEVIGKHETACGERRLTYVDIYQTTKTKVTCSVPYGILGNYIYLSKPDKWLIARSAEEKNQTEVLDCWPKYI